jgi:hypothetical protein
MSQHRGGEPARCATSDDQDFRESLHGYQSLFSTEMMGRSGSGTVL